MGCLGDSSGGNCPERMSCVVFAQNAKASIPISVICRLHNYKLKKKNNRGGGRGADVDHAGKTCCCVILPTGVFDLSSYLIFNNFGQYFFHHFCKKKTGKMQKNT